MNAVALPWPESTLTSFVQALLHSLWIAGVAALLLWSALRVIPGRHAAQRYALSLLAQIAIALATIATWSALDYEPRAQAVPPGVANAAPADLNSAPSRSELAVATDDVSTTRVESLTSVPVVERSETWALVLFAVWLLGSLIMLARMALTISGTRRLAALPTLDDSRLLAMLDELRLRLGIGRRGRAVVSEANLGPAVIGIVRPTLVLPLSMLTGAPGDALEVVVAHELAHIRRHDFLINIVQMLIEALLYFNPAVWWVGRQMRREREACCDAVALSVVGEPATYARVLADWADRQRGLTPVAATQAFAATPGGLLDRVSRLLVPDYQPRPRISWATLVVLALSAVLVLSGLRRGTTAAVELVAQALSPAERVQQVAKVKQEFQSNEFYSGPSQEKAIVSGRIRTHDGKPIPKIRRSHYHTTKRTGPNSTNSISGNLGRLAEQFSEKVPLGETWIWIETDDYATAVIGPLDTRPGGTIEDLDVVLLPGIDATLSIVDEEGTPVPNTKVKCHFLVGRSRHCTSRFRGDADGRVAVEHVLERPYEVTVTRRGFQTRVVKDVVFRSGQTVPVTLLRAAPATGTVRTPDGVPIADASVGIVHIRQANGHDHSFGSFKVEATAVTDAQGVFVLDSLTDHWSYTLAVTSPKHGRALVTSVTTGQRDIDVRLENIVLKGTIEGDLRRLRKRNGKLVIEYRPQARLADDSVINGVEYFPVVVADGVGRFEIPRAFPVETRIRASIDARTTLAVSRSMDDIVLTIPVKESKPKAAMRRVTVRFTTPDDAVTPTGTFSAYNYTSDRNVISNSKRLTPSIEDGTATFLAFAPGRLALKPTGMAGYWFEEETHEIEAGTQTLKLTIPLEPAGAIVGRVLNPDGTSATGNVYVHAQATEKPAHLQQARIDIRDFRADERGRFFLSPFPLGATYVVYAARDRSRQVSPEVVLNAARPTREISIQLPQTTSADALVIDEEGRPIAGMPVSLRLRLPPASTSWSPPYVSDRRGQLRMENVNTTVGEYTLYATPKKDYLPTKVPLRRDGETTVIRLEPGHVIEGRLIDEATGWPVPGAELYALPKRIVPDDTGWLEPERKTDAQGRFRFSNLDTRIYRIYGREGVDCGEFSAHAGATGSVTIRGKLAEWCKLKPVPPGARGERK
ncbi:MAG: hypothetical protein CMJ48_07535 [Planctomycetaceae bacterium]|nr:hypothetical protein [Planctomycetaceae bacterium]